MTGKPVILGGIPGRRQATGSGVMLTVIEALDVMGKSPKDVTVAVQGFGNVGAAAALELFRMGCKVVGISRSQRRDLQRNGLDVAALQKYYLEHGKLQGFAGSKSISGEALLEIECDVLVPAASGNQITAENAAKIKASIIAEGANGPTSSEADRILEKRVYSSFPTFSAMRAACSSLTSNTRRKPSRSR